MSFSVAIFILLLIAFVTEVQCYHLPQHLRPENSYFFNPHLLPFHTIPAKVQVQIFQFVQVPPGSLLSCLLVCRRWYKFLYGESFSRGPIIKLIL